jgi:hypothetical protein
MHRLMQRLGCPFRKKNFSTIFSVGFRRWRCLASRSQLISHIIESNDKQQQHMPLHMPHISKLINNKICHYLASICILLSLGATYISLLSQPTATRQHLCSLASQRTRTCFISSLSVLGWTSRI